MTPTTVEPPAAAPAPRLAPAAVAMLESLYQHRLLSTLQLHELHTPNASLRWTQRVLGRARDVGLADAVRVPGGGLIWYLTEPGVEAVETIPNRAELRRKVIPPEQAAGPLQAHTLAVNDVGIAFVTAARVHDHECGPFAWRHEVAHPLGPPPGRRRPEQLISDAVLSYELTEPGGATSFHYRFVELDRATIPVADLVAKLARYARLYHYVDPADRRDGDGAPLWTRLYPVFPLVLLVFAGDVPRRLERRRRTVLALCGQEPELTTTPEVEVSACLLADLIERGPFDASFRTLAEPDTPVDWLGEQR
jgi:hypothetical protein